MVSFLWDRSCSVAGSFQINSLSVSALCAYEALKNKVHFENSIKSLWSGKPGSRPPLESGASRPPTSKGQASIPLSEKKNVGKLS